VREGRKRPVRYRIGTEAGVEARSVGAAERPTRASPLALHRPPRLLTRHRPRRGTA
jgi:hypothetical protein